MITFHIHSFGAPENNTADSSNIAGENLHHKNDPDLAENII
jgi:hypothetical protein